MSPESPKPQTAKGPVARRWMRTRSDCRLCGSLNLEPVIPLGETPLANEFVKEADRGKPQDCFPLTVYLCLECGHAQLRDVVDPERLFRNYVYVSSTSPVFVDHFKRYAEDIRVLLDLKRGDKVVEIGSNDGVLLRHFKDAGLNVLGVDPAKDIASRASESGIRTLPEFFTVDLAKKLRAEGWGANVVTANNVFAHADDLHGIVEGVEQLLRPDGLFVFEVSYLVDVFQKTLFDTIYHEHLSYHTVKPLKALFGEHGMELVDAIRVDAHGGSLRGIAQLQDGPLAMRPRVQELIAVEESLGLDKPETYTQLMNRITAIKDELRSLLTEMKKKGFRLAGFGAPAKATTLLYAFGLGPKEFDYLIDDSPLKQGLFSPGHHLPVVSSQALYDSSMKPDAVVVLAWNFSKSILAKHERFMKTGGRFIVPLPKIEVSP